MKVLKRLKGYVIVSLSDRDKEQHSANCDFACVLNDEMEIVPALRELDMECGSLKEAIDFIG
jgi:hypothetical protein